METQPDPQSALPEVPSDLQSLSDSDLARTAQEFIKQEHALEERIAPIRAQIETIQRARARIATEIRRRERMATHARRRALQEAFSDTAHPLLESGFATPDLFPPELPLAHLHCALRTGGAVQLGFSTKRGIMSFTDGTEVRSATTWGECTGLYLSGWQPGTKTLPGIRVVLLESRIERVVPTDDVCIVLNEDA